VRAVFEFLEVTCNIDVQARTIGRALALVPSLGARVS
jgi:hypothetical protein